MADVQATRDKLMQEFNEVVSDTEQLLKSVGSAGGEKVQALRAGIEQNLKSARERMRLLEAAARERTAAAAKATDEYVHENPWQSLAIAAGVAAIAGIVVGLLLNRDR